jgi:hypothetical protein
MSKSKSKDKIQKKKQKQKQKKVLKKLSAPADSYSSGPEMQFDDDLNREEEAEEEEAEKAEAEEEEAEDDKRQEEDDEVEQHFESGDEEEEEEEGEGEEEGDRDEVNDSEAALIWKQFGTKPDGFENKLKKSQLVATMRYATNYWIPAKTSQGSALKLAKKLFGRTPCKCGELFSSKMKKTNFTMEDIVYVYRCEMFKRIRLEAALRQRGMLETSFGGRGLASEHAGEKIDDLVGYSRQLARMQECISRCFKLLQSERYFYRAVDPSVDASCATVPDVFGFVPFNESSLTKYESFIIFILRQLYDRSYRRYNGGVYEQIFSPDGRATHAYKCIYDDMKKFITQATSKEDTFAQWQIMLSPGNLAHASTYLATAANEVEFRDLKPDRHWHAFRNGLYFTKKAEFYEYGHDAIPGDIVACKYHDVLFDTSLLDIDDILEIPTDASRKLIEFQIEIMNNGGGAGTKRTAEEVRHILYWMYVFFGRLLFEVGEMDCWQVILFIVGRAGCGKSVLLQAVGKFFEECDVETMANNSQKGFGLETFVHKMMWRCYEVKSDFSLDQAQLQSMISGEDMSIQRKNLTALNVVWKVPGILAGNEFADWADNSGSISRRIVLMNFDRRVPPNMVDPGLLKKIEMEMPAMLHKSCKAYLDAVEKYGKNDIWASKDGVSILPSIFLENKKNLKKGTHNLAAFLNSELDVELGEDLCIPFKIFKKLADAFYQTSGFSKFQWKEDKFNTVFEDNGITRRRLKADEVSRGMNVYGEEELDKKEEWLFGVGARVKDGADLSPGSEKDKRRGKNDRGRNEILEEMGGEDDL